MICRLRRQFWQGKSHHSYGLACEISPYSVKSVVGMGAPKIQNLGNVPILPVLQRLGVPYDF